MINLDIVNVAILFRGWIHIGIERSRTLLSRVLSSTRDQAVVSHGYIIEFIMIVEPSQRVQMNMYV